MRARVAGATLAAALALPGTAFADATIQAVDGSQPDGSDNRWAPNAVTVKVGETVTWSFAGTTLAHNVKSAGGWEFSNAPAVGGPPATHVFTAPGTYEFFCQLHASPMRGTVTVTDETGAPPPPPPPPPLSEQPFPNDAPALAGFEVRDTVAPRLSRVKVRRVHRGARVRFRLSEAAKVTIRLTRHGHRARQRTVEVRKGSSSVTLRHLRAGAYRVRVRAVDLAGNRAKAARSARVSVR